MKKTCCIWMIAFFLVTGIAPLVTAGPVMDRILKKGELVVGTTANQPPLNATSKSGQVIGFDADLARSMADTMGVKIKFVTLPFAELLPALEKGKLDIILSGMTMSPKRNLKVAFADPLACCLDRAGTSLVPPAKCVTAPGPGSGSGCGEPLLAERDPRAR